MKSAPHIYSTRVYYHDTDAGNVVYHARYADFAERARTEMLREAGFSVMDLYRNEGIFLVVKTMTLDFHFPARLDDVVDIRTQVDKVGSASLTLQQAFYCGEVALVTAHVVMVGVKQQGGQFKPHGLPQRLRDLLTS